MIKPKKHVFVCINERDDGRDCCAHVQGKEIFYALKTWVIETGLARDVWVTKTGCLGFCNNVGANVVIYPEGTWFLQTKLEELDEVKKAVLEQL